MIVSIEVPVVRGEWLVQCIDSVLQQTSANWRLTLRWDGGDTWSREILERVSRAGHPRVRVHFGERSGIARARQSLTAVSYGNLILPLDDDDLLEPSAVETFITMALRKPWAGLLRARRAFIDEAGAPVDMADWFPFERRQYTRGATCDISNHAQPYAIRRELFVKAGGWQGFEAFEFAGEDCDCFARMEEVSEIELIDAVLYRYRLHDLRTSHRVSLDSANTMWARIADRAAERREVRAERRGTQPPFAFHRRRQDVPAVKDLEVVVPFWESHEQEAQLRTSRPMESAESGQVVLHAGAHFWQVPEVELGGLSRLALAVSTTGPVEGALLVALYRTGTSCSPDVVLQRSIALPRGIEFEFVSIDAGHALELAPAIGRLEITFEPAVGNRHHLMLHTVRSARGPMHALMRAFHHAPDHCRRGLDRCLTSLASAGIARSAIHVIEERDSSSANRNRGFRGTTAPWIVFMDDDAELAAPDTLQSMLRTMTSLDADLVGPKLLNGHGQIYSGLPVTNPLTAETRVMGMGEDDRGQYDLDVIAPWVPSTVLVVHRSVMLVTGGFDERFQGSQHEDADFCLRARSRGFDCCYAGNTTAIHHNALRNSQSSGNSAYFAERWRGRPDLFVSPLVTPAAARRRL